MCTQSQLTDILTQVAQTAKAVFAEHYCEMILYGSYARGDQDDESDVDIMVLADVPIEDLSQYRKMFHTVLDELEFKYDIVVSLVLRDKATFDRYLDALPFYQAVRKEGVSVA